MAPFVEFTDYKNWIEFEGVYKTQPRGLKNGFATFKPALIRFMQAFICIALHLSVVMGLGISVYFAGTQEFINYKSFFHRFVFYYIGMSGQRMMYYAPWCFTEAACIACGLSYNGMKRVGVKDVISWDSIMCIDILGVEFGNTPLRMMGKWNHGTHLWLKNHVQQRLLKPGQKPGIKETYLTFAVSAFWHGFYPFYYIMFFMCACLTELSKDIYRSRILFNFIPSEYRNIVANVAAMSMLNYLGVAFN